jgi:hypothetical protein
MRMHDKYMLAHADCPRQEATTMATGTITGATVRRQRLLTVAGGTLVLERFRMNADRVWLVVAPIALLASMGSPLSGHGVSAGNRLALIGMHLAVAAFVIPFLYRSAASRRDRAAA